MGANIELKAKEELKESVSEPAEVGTNEEQILKEKKKQVTDAPKQEKLKKEKKDTISTAHAEVKDKEELKESVSVPTKVWTAEESSMIIPQLEKPKKGEKEPISAANAVLKEKEEIKDFVSEPTEARTNAEQIQKEEKKQVTDALKQEKPTKEKKETIILAN